MSTGEHPNTREAPTTDQQLPDHTFGPWWVDDRRESGGVLQIQAKHRGEGSTYCVATVNIWDQPNANARLIAAAPDLLASLKEMGDWIAAGLQASDEAWPDARCLQHTEEIAARARAAVDKAEGRSNG